MSSWFLPELTTLFQVVLIDLALAGDNAIVIGLAAAGLPLDQRPKAVLIGIAAATVLRIAFAMVATQLLQVVGLVLAGGVLLLWVSWKMLRELRTSRGETGGALEALAEPDINADGTISKHTPQKSFKQAAAQIIIADVSMSLDNILAVAGAAREHISVLVVGLGLSVALMGIAAGYIARLLGKYRWIAYAGLLMILYVAVEMVFRGLEEVWPLLSNATIPVIGGTCIGPVELRNIARAGKGAWRDEEGKCRKTGSRRYLLISQIICIDRFG